VQGNRSLDNIISIKLKNRNIYRKEMYRKGRNKFLIILKQYKLGNRILKRKGIKENFG